MATATVNFNGLETVSLQSGQDIVLEVNRTGIVNRDFPRGSLIPLKNGQAFVLEGKVQFLLDDGMKFEVGYSGKFKVIFCI